MTKSPPTFISKRQYPFNDGSGYANTMYLYEVGEKFELNALIEFCKEKKSEYNIGMFHVLTFFDNKENATFPNNPPTAGFVKKKDMIHIFAEYTYNPINNYSVLSYFPKNQAESMRIEFDI